MKGDIQKLPYDIYNYDGGSVGNMVCCPYSDFIPFYYLGKNHTLFKKLKKGFVGFNKENCRKEINKYIFYNTPATESNYGRGTSNSDRLQQIFKEGVLRNFHQRSYDGQIGQFAVFLRSDIEYKPVILLVVPKENWIAAKLEYLTTGEVSLSKCILLIDKNLGSPKFWLKNFRNGLFKNYLASILETLDVDVWKVPERFIAEKCFIGTNLLMPKNIMERKRCIETMKKEFLEILKKENFSTLNTSLSAWSNAGEATRLSASEGLILTDSDTYTWAVQIGNSDTVSDGQYIVGVDPVSGQNQPVPEVAQDFRVRQEVSEEEVVAYYYGRPDSEVENPPLPF